jgi:hypothetical protein
MNDKPALSITSLAQLGRVDKEIEVNSELRVKLHTLSVAEQQRALASIPEGLLNEIARYAFLQEAILIQATEAVNGQNVTREQAKEFYSMLQYNVMAELFGKYSDMAGEQNQVLEELKKK